MVVIALAVLYSLLDERSAFAAENEFLLVIFEGEAATLNIDHSFEFPHMPPLYPVPSVDGYNCQHCLSEFREWFDHDLLLLALMGARHSIIYGLDFVAVLL